MDYFGSIQSGVAKFGTERVTNRVRSELLANLDAFVITLDFANAFNETSRAAVRRQLDKRLLYLVPFFDVRYRQTTRYI